MKDIAYTLTFHSYWHCGSGLAAGADVDLLVVKDTDGLPYVPGKTLKGLLREAAESLQQFCPEKYGQADLDACLGKLNTESVEPKKGTCFFSNAILSKEEREALASSVDLKNFLYDSLSATAIDPETGTAREHSLRKMQVTVPCQLEGCILNVPDDCTALIADSMKLIKRLGVGRNRGLGRCTLKMEGGQA